MFFTCCFRCCFFVCFSLRFSFCLNIIWYINWSVRSVAFHVISLSIVLCQSTVLFELVSLYKIRIVERWKQLTEQLFVYLLYWLYIGYTASVTGSHYLELNCEVNYMCVTNLFKPSIHLDSPIEMSRTEWKRNWCTHSETQPHTHTRTRTARTIYV